MKTIRNLSLMAALVWATACGKELSAIALFTSFTKVSRFLSADFLIARNFLHNRRDKSP